MKQYVQPGEVIPITLKWSYFTGIGTPEIFISAYTKWDPFTEIRLFSGDIHGEGSQTLSFQITAPTEPGYHKIRIFNASSHGSVQSYYGTPPPEDEYRPCNVPYTEIEISVRSPDENKGQPAAG
jgi:hypothetical protein